MLTLLYPCGLLVVWLLGIRKLIFFCFDYFFLMTYLLLSVMLTYSYYVLNKTMKEFDTE